MTPAGGAPVWDTGDHVFVDGSNRLPSLRAGNVCPPQTNIRVPVQTAMWRYRGDGAPLVDVCVHTFACRS
jgi:hypothetical protein